MWLYSFIFISNSIIYVYLILHLVFYLWFNWTNKKKKTTVKKKKKHLSNFNVLTHRRDLEASWVAHRCIDPLWACSYHAAWSCQTSRRWCCRAGPHPSRYRYGDCNHGAQMPSSLLSGLQHPLRHRIEKELKWDQLKQDWYNFGVNIILHQFREELRQV